MIDTPLTLNQVKDKPIATLAYIDGLNCEIDKLNKDIQVLAEALDECCGYVTYYNGDHIQALKELANKHLKEGD